MQNAVIRHIKKSRVVNNPIDIVWEKWTTHEGLLTFFGHDNQIEFEIGGVYEIYFLMDNPLGLRGGEGNKILSYLPQKMLSFTWNAPPQYPEIRDHTYKTWVVVEYQVIEKDKTEVTIHHLGWKEGEKWDEVYDYFDKAWVNSA